MNRRDALKAAAQVAISESKIPGIESHVVDVTTPFIAVITCDRHLSKQEVSNFRIAWKTAIAKTDYPQLPLVILDGGKKLHIVNTPRESA